MINKKYQNSVDPISKRPSDTSKIQAFVVNLDEELLQRIGTIAERENKDPQAIVKEIIVRGLSREEEREGISHRPTSYRGNQDYDLTQRVTEMYTDGGCRGNPGPGGWAAVVYEGPKPEEISGSEWETTNQRMELRAAIEGLRHLKDPSRVRLYSDSAYLLNALNKGWLTKWESNGWKKADNKPVKNADLWREILMLSRFHKVEWVKVKGHSGNAGNERCHTLVQIAIARGR